MSPEPTRSFRSLSLFVLLIFSVGASQSQQVNPPKPKSEPQPAQTDAEKRQASFELVWQTVDKNFYDPNFNGVNWKAVHDHYAPLVAGTKTDEELYLLLQQMVNELHQSHFMIVPPQAIPKLASADADNPDDAESDNEIEAAKPLDRIRRRLSERLSTGIGIDIRILDGAAVITRVDPGSPAARTGLRPGFVIKSVNGKPLSEAIAQIEQNPIFHQIIRPEVPLILVASYINGNLRDPVQLTYVNGRNLQRSVRITRQKLNGEMSPAIGNLPPLFTEFEAKRLAGGIGYIRFNAFVPMLMKKVCAALREMHDAPALIIDLRGNQGGLLGMIGGLAGLLEQSPANLGSMKTRTGYNSVFAFPQRVPYTGPLAILIDGSTLSAGEIFAAGLQETFRAVIVGDVSAGNTLPSGIVKLPTGALFQYAFGNYQTPNGIFLEGRGVIPDRIVKLNRRTLLVGGDPQLTAAVRKLRERVTFRLPGELVVDVSADTNANNPGTEKSKSSVEPSPPPPKPA
ncbi:MAG TPA: S41 family peptidase, partial [Pyrinomonadaceae bacterium]|nr:S41 family peptidase [Pyrinomonadaceae bacterium]